MLRYQRAWKFYFRFSPVGLGFGFLPDFKDRAAELHLTDMWNISACLPEIVVLVYVATG